MTSENISFLEAFQDAQVPPSMWCGAPFDMASANPTINLIPKLLRPPLSSLPNATHLPAPSFSAGPCDATGGSFVPTCQGQGAVSVPDSFNPNSSPSAPLLCPEMYGACGASFVPTYQGPGAISVPQNPTPNSTLPVPSSLSPEMYGSGGASFVTTYQGHGAVSVSESLTPTRNPIISTQPSLSQDMYGAGGASFIPTEQGQSTVSIPKNFTPNPTFSPPSISPEMYCASGASFPSNYQVQGTIPPPESFTPPMFPVNNIYFRRAFYPFHDMLPNVSTTAFPPSNSGQNAQASPVPLPWPLPMQPLATASQQQPQFQVLQEGGAEMEPLREPGSVYRECYQPKVASYAAPSAPEMSLQRLGNQPGFPFPVKNTMSKNRRKGQAPMRDQRGADEYYCEPCDDWFPTRMKKRHDRKHDGDHVCRICEILEKACKPLSRKDALKRHVEKKHPEFKHLLKNISLGILVPRRKNVPEDLQELKQAMFPTL